MQRPNPLYVQKLKEIVNSSPFPHHMAMTLTHVDFDRSEVQLQTAECHLQPFGIVHGGVLATLIDTATFWAVFMRLPQDAGLVNVDLKLNYLRPVKDGRLQARGLSIRSGRSVSYAEARVFDSGGELLAHGTSTLMALPGKGIHLDVPKFVSE